MSSESLPAKKPKSRVLAKLAIPGEPPPDAIGLRVLDALLIAGFLALTFLLGLFPLKDTDFWWHLRTGDLIRQTGVVPSHDFYTYTSGDRPWIDLHWTFQVALSWLYERGGIPALTVAKSVITCLAVFLLITAKKREWPVWAMLLGWIPAILVLSGRNYIRPETFTLIYLCSFLAILVRIERAPRLAYLLPILQVGWVNAQGLFVFGPLLLSMALIDAALRPGAFASARTKWWRQLGIASVLTGLACLVNPYGLTGTLYPWQIAKTMRNSTFSNSIAELTPILVFIKRDGFTSLPLRLHLVTMALGGLSFAVPLIWVIFNKFLPVPTLLTSRKDGEEKPENSKKVARKRAKKSDTAATAVVLQLSLFRLMLFVVFSLLSLQATRNSHQFAAVAGAVTAWNVAEWAAAVRRRAWLVRKGLPEIGRGVFPGAATLATIFALFLWVATGGFYTAAAEGRTIGVGEQPLWFPHDAVKFSATPGMPKKFLAFHIGHSSLYDYYFGPERKSFVDARLEVIGVELFEKYMTLQRKISDNDTGWSRELDAVGRPSVLADHEMNSSISAAMLTSPDYRCVFFDPVAAVFVHVSNTEVVERHTVDFAARHFGAEPGVLSSNDDMAKLLASAKGLRNLAGQAGGFSPEKARPLILLGSKYARRYTETRSDGPEGWKLLGQFETLREPPPLEPVARFRQPFDPLFDLSAARATYAFREALDLAPYDFSTLMLLSELFRSRGLTEAALPLMERLSEVSPINRFQTKKQEQFKELSANVRAALGAMPNLKWENLSELGLVVNRLLGSGRAESAALCLERAGTSEARTWEDADRIAGLWLHLGQPAKARALWEIVPKPPSEALRSSRIGTSYLTEGEFAKARESYKAALAADPDLFESLYGLALLEQDAGHAPEALDAARKAEKAAKNDVARSAVRTIIVTVTPYATSGIAR